jgi:hypothetical protein
MAAGYTTSLLLAAQARLADRLQQPEFKHEPYYLIKLLLDRGQNLVTPGTYQQYKVSDQRTIYGYAFAKRAITAGSARAYNHSSAALGDTQQVTITNTIITANYGITLKSGGRNLFTREEMLAKELESAAIAINDVLEAAIAAWFSTWKIQTNGASTGWAKFGQWDGTNYMWNVPASAEKWFFQYIQEIMSICDYNGPLDLVCDNAAWAIAQQLMAQGGANETNTGWQFGNLNLVKSRRVADTTVQATVYAIPRGTVGMVNRIPKENIEGFVGKAQTYSNMMDPLGSGLLEAVHYLETPSDSYTSGAETQDIMFEYENSTDYGLVKAPISTGAYYTPIYKFVLGN